MRGACPAWGPRNSRNLKRRKDLGRRPPDFGLPTWCVSGHNRQPSESREAGKRLMDRAWALTDHRLARKGGSAVKNRKHVWALVVFGWSWGGLGGVVRGQVLERDTTLTGPRGRTIQRQVEIKRGPG